jgi:hypothetical protein
MSKTLAATLIGTAAGLVTWLSGLGSLIWPAHPQLTDFLVTVAVGIVVNQIWPSHSTQSLRP